MATLFSRPYDNIPYTYLVFHQPVSTKGIYNVNVVSSSMVYLLNDRVDCFIVLGHQYLSETCENKRIVLSWIRKMNSSTTLISNILSQNFNNI